MPSPDILERQDTQATDGEERDRHAHIVIGGNHTVTEAMVMGTPVTALCGKTWVPSRDPKRYPMCPTCKEVCEKAGRTPPT